MSSDPARETELHFVERGRREAFATTALILSLVSFVNLMGAEKSILAIALAALALRGAVGAIAHKRGRIAIAVASLHVITILVVLVLLRDKFAQLIELLRQLG